MTFRKSILQNINVANNVDKSNLMLKIMKRAFQKNPGQASQSATNGQYIKMPEIISDVALST